MFKSFSNNLITVLLTVFILFSFSISAFADDEEVTVPVDSAAVTSDVELSDYQFNRDINGLELAPLMVDEYSAVRSADPNNIVPNLSSVSLYNASVIRNDDTPSYITTFSYNDVSNPRYFHSLLVYDPYVYSKLSSISSSLGGLNTADIVSAINSARLSNHNDLSNIINNTSNLTNFYDRNHNDLVQVNTDLNSFKSQNHSDIQSLKTSFEDIKWNSMTLSSSSITSVGQYVNKYIATFTPTYFYQSPTIYRVRFDFRPNDFFTNLNYNDIDFYWNENAFNENYYYERNSLISFAYLYTLPLYNQSTSSYSFRVSLPAGVNYRVGNGFYIDYISLDSQPEDFLKVYTYLMQNHMDNDLHSIDLNIDKLRRMYASDDELAAKEAQQGYESSALNDFTGNGSAAVNSTDSGNVKNISGTVKSGLNTGGSVSGGLGIFQNDNYFWGWFSTDCASWFTLENTRSNNLLYKVKSEGELITTLPDLVTERDNDYFELLGR